MKATSKETYKVLRAILELKKFKQYEISKKEKITFSLVNRVVNWLVYQHYVVKRTGYYEVTAPTAIFALFPLHRKLKPYATFDVNLTQKELFKLIKNKAKLCLTSALSYYDNYFRDPAIYIYLDDKKIVQELKSLPKGYTHIELYKEDLNDNDFVKKDKRLITSKIRTTIDLFCANKAYAAERLIKNEWI